MSVCTYPLVHAIYGGCKKGCPYLRFFKFLYRPWASRYWEFSSAAKSAVATISSVMTTSSVSISLKVLWQ